MKARILFLRERDRAVFPPNDRSFFASRHGDPEKLGERGRPRDGTKAGARETFSHWSPRKFERRWQARKKALETPDNRKE